MRYYDIVISDTAGTTTTLSQPSSDEIVATGTKPFFRHWSSVTADGKNNPGALNIEIDAFVVPFANAAGGTGASLKIWGIPWSDISKSADFAGKSITVSGGMSKGLPLANPRQAGQLFSGRIAQAYGNWVGTGMVLNFVIFPDVGSDAEPANLVFPWRKGAPIGTAIQTMLQTAFPSATVNLDTLNPALVLGHDQPGVFQSMVQFATWLRDFTKTLVNKSGYPGVEILFSNNIFRIFDTPMPIRPTEISFLDLVGQPTWLTLNQIQVITVMRADIAVGDFVTLPPGPQTIQPQAVGLVKNRTTFSGTFLVTQVRHVGNFRQADGTAWITALDMVQPDQ